MPRTTTADGIEIEYEVLGPDDGVPLLLVMGLGGQLIRWPDDLCADFVDRGYRVIRYDNRDVGLSTHLDDRTVDVVAVMTEFAAGRHPEVPYRLSDMAADGIAVLDALGIDRAHVVGVSMGGMIVQTMAIEHPDRVATMTSIMSTTGDRDVGQPTAEAALHLLSPPPRSREEAMDREVDSARTWGSPDHVDEPRLRAIAGRAWDRRHDAAGVARQLAAITASGSRSDALRSLDVPSLVIHGDQDQLVTPSGGRRTAELIPCARYLEIEGMGHDLVPALWGQIVAAVVDHTSTHGGDR